MLRTTLATVLVLASLSLAQSIPPGEMDANARINASPRHAEYVDVPMGEKNIRAYVVYPERKEKAPVVIVIHEIFGLTDWIKSVADQLAADGFIAVAPDYLSGRGKDGGGTESFASRDETTAAVRAIKPDDAAAITSAARDYAVKLPAANGKYATVGFCWGGARSFEYAAADKNLSAAVVYYGTSPADAAAYEKIAAPVLGLYGSDDARVNQTVPNAVEQMKKLNKTFKPLTYEGAGHGFLRQQDGRNGANLKASQAAWPETVKFIKQYTE